MRSRLGSIARLFRHALICSSTGVAVRILRGAFLGFIHNDHSFGICTLLQTQLTDFSDEFVCIHPGVEVLLPPYPVRELKVGSRSFLPRVSMTPIPFSGVREHRERFRNCSSQITSMVATPIVFDALLEPIDRDWTGLEFDYRPGDCIDPCGPNAAKRWLPEEGITVRARPMRNLKEASAKPVTQTKVNLCKGLDRG